MTQELQQLMAQLPILNDVSNLTLIKKGFSEDEKWKVELAKGQRYFLRVSDLRHSRRKQLELDDLKSLWEAGAPVPAPITFVEAVELGKCVQLTEFVEGEDGEDVLSKLTTREQYEVGRDAGTALYQIHSMAEGQLEETWEVHRYTE